MKKLTLLLGLMLLLLPFLISAQTVQAEGMSWMVGFGDWAAKNGKLYQEDENTGYAQINVPVSQRGVVEFEFTVRYNEGGYNEGTMDDGPYHGGFGVHIGVDSPAKGMAWGNGKSYLLWLNMDTRMDTAKNYPQHLGFRAQVFKSDNNYMMDLMSDYNVDIPAALGLTLDQIKNAGILWKYVNMDVPVKINVDTRSGKVKVYDPSIDPETYGYAYAYSFYLDPSILKNGKYLSLRTNDLGLIFDDFKVSMK
jgi:hypothetical protein